MPTPALLLLIATLLPLVSFTLLLFVGKRIGKPYSGWIAFAFIATSFALSVGALISWLGAGTWHEGRAWGAGKGPIDIMVPWIPTWVSTAGSAAAGAGVPTYLQVGIYVDSLTLTMFLMVTLVSALVHVFSIGYMHEDTRFPRFFTYLGLFCFSMLGLVLGGTILQLFIFWELVGLCSYLLIGFWYEKKSASNAAIKAFVTNRVGDFGFLIGFGILFFYVGNSTLPDLWKLLSPAALGHDVLLPSGEYFRQTMLTVMGIGLFCGAVGKSAQFPLHVWLPDAMEGPTPVSALIHAATMVAAGVYLVGRLFPILTPETRMVIATIGLITLTMAALIAIVQSDIKKVLAFSTVSQLGFMVLAMGIGSWTGALFHLITHAFFKALLFLGSGSVIHAAHHEQEMPQYGGLLKRIPFTGITFAIAVLAIAGTPLFSGYYSKDTLLIHAAAFASLGISKWHWAYFAIPCGIAYITAFYMTRCWTLTFLGKPRNHHLHDHAKELPILYVPLIILAILAIFGGNILVQTMLRNTIEETRIHCSTAEKPFRGFEPAWQNPMVGEAHDEAGEAGESLIPSPMIPATTPEVKHAIEHGEHVAHTWVFPAFIVGIGLGLALYLPGYRVVNRFYAFAPIRMIHTWLYNRMYIDDMYNVVWVGGTHALARACGLFDKYVLDGIVNAAGLLVRVASWVSGMIDKYVVDGAVALAGAATAGVGAVGRSVQTGRIRSYVTMLMLMLAFGLVLAVVLILK
jgi:proton-translocating NADH-quinone oxidoreductase chain L